MTRVKKVDDQRPGVTCDEIKLLKFLKHFKIFLRSYFRYKIGAIFPVIKTAEIDLKFS